MYSLTQQEETYYNQLWSTLDRQNQGFAEGRETVMFFKKSRLPVQTLRGIWLASVKNEEGKIYYNEFLTAMRLVAYCQNGFEFNEQLVNETRPVPLPTMEGFQLPSAPPQPTLPQSNFYQTQPVLPQNSTQSQLTQIQSIPIQSQILSQPVLSQIQQSPILSLNQQLPTMPQTQPLLTQIPMNENKVQSTQYDLQPDVYQKYETFYYQQDKSGLGYIQSEQGKAFFQKSNLSAPILIQVWDLVDTGKKGYLFKNEFIVAMHLIQLCRQNTPLPAILPDQLQQILKRDQQSEVRATSQTMPSMPVQRVNSQNEIQGLNQQSNYLQNKLQNQTQQIQLTNSLDQQKQIIEDKKKDIDFLNQTIQKLQSFYDYLKQEQDELSLQISQLAEQQQLKQQQITVLSESIQNQLQVNSNLQKQLIECKAQNNIQNQENVVPTDAFKTLHVDDDYDYSNYKAKKDKITSGGNKDDMMPWN